MRVFLITTENEGHAGDIELPSGTTVQALFAARMPDAVVDNFLLRVNRLLSAPQQVLRDGDRISITPMRIEGARARHADSAV